MRPASGAGWSPKGAGGPATCLRVPPTYCPDDGATGGRGARDRRCQPVHGAGDRGRQRPAVVLAGVLRARHIYAVLLGVIAGCDAFAEHRGLTGLGHRHLRFQCSDRHRSGRLPTSRGRGQRRRPRRGHRGIFPAVAGTRRCALGAGGRAGRQRGVSGNRRRALDPGQGRPPRSPDTCSAHLTPAFRRRPHTLISGAAEHAILVSHR